VDKTPVTLSKGLQYIDIAEGGGAPATNGSSLTVIYTGWLQSTGQKFDSTYDNGGQPFSVTLGEGKIIEGWDKGLIGVRSGGTRRLIIPAELAYGSRGQSQGKVPIPPNATLIFDVTVVSIQ
jgi:FKBP-type peptidyl-prolyl cis-trans isomerase FkpA